MARLVGALEHVDLKAGVVLFEEGAEADALYLLEHGKVLITVASPAGEHTLAELEGPAHFGELGLLLARRTSTARAATDVRVWRLSRERFERLARERAGVALAVATSVGAMLEERQRRFVGAPQRRRRIAERPAAETAVAPQRSTRERILGGAIAVGVPLVLWNLAPPSGLSQQGWHVILVLVGASVGWLFEPVPDFVVALLMTAAWGIAGLAPLSLAFAGFASSSWVLALGALALAAAMARSGLLYRISLVLLRVFPPTHRGQVLALLAGGFLITPMVPLATARVAATAPLAGELAQALGYERRGRASAALAFAGLVGYGSFSPVFLTGLAMNFFVVDLLSADDRARFGWVGWLLAALPTGLLFLVGITAVLLFVFRSREPERTTSEVVERQRRVLGRLSRRERITLAAVGVLLLGLVVQPLLRVETAWLAVAALGVAVGGGALERERFRDSIDWGFLVLFGILLGTGGVLQKAGVAQWIADGLLPLTRAVSEPAILLALLVVLVVVARLVLPRQPAALLLSLALVPAAARLGLNAWLVGFVILLTAHTWLHPSQSDFYRLTRELTRDELFTDRHGVELGVALTVLTLLAVLVSVPYWRAIGLL